MKLWTPEETLILIQNYNSVSNEGLSMLIPNKTKNSIYKKAYKLGLRKSKEITFLNRSQSRKGAHSNNWNGGVRITSNGYRQILYPRHPRADKSGYVMEHVVIWEKESGFPVPSGCCIHHLNGNKADNRIENLCLMLHGAHTAFHNKNKHLSEETKRKISQKAKLRFSDKRNHPFYKEIDAGKLLHLRESGLTVDEVCRSFSISKSTYYSKIRGV